MEEEEPLQQDDLSTILMLQGEICDTHELVAGINKFSKLKKSQVQEMQQFATPLAKPDASEAKTAS